MDEVSANASGAQYRVLGMDCARDAAEIEAAVRRISGVGAVKVSTATHVLTVRDAAGDRLPEVVQAVEALGYRLQPVSDEGEGRGDAVARPAHGAPAYRRALWVVVLLNAGYGLIEMIGGFVAASQAVKADALDFLGDGLITMLGLLAIAWSSRWRARAALLQGLFLGAMGLGVIGATIFRFIERSQPEPLLMGVLGAAALAVNIGAALVLIPHRAGDANVRAVWLFSRNDAIGNVAVVGAATLVRWTGSDWPDLVVALGIATLFLHSATMIIRDARTELRS